MRSVKRGTVACQGLLGSCSAFMSIASLGGGPTTGSTWYDPVTIRGHNMGWTVERALSFAEVQLASRPHDR